MVIISSFIFATIAMLAIFSIAASLSYALPQILKAISNNGRNDMARMRTIRVSIPQQRSADIIALDPTMQQRDAARAKLKLAA